MVDLKGFYCSVFGSSKAGNLGQGKGPSPIFLVV